MIRIVLALILAISCAYAAFHFTLEKGFVNPYPVMCELVAQKIYLDDAEIKNWKRLCQRRARLVTPYSSRKLILKDMNNALALLKVSHLEVYDSSEVASIWRGQSLETGIESQFVEGELVVFRIHPGSPADRAGLRKGDIIQSINADQPNPWEAQSQSGSYLILRGEREFSVKLKPAEIQRHEEMSIERINGVQAVLQVPSFRAAFFEPGKLEKIAKDLEGVTSLVVDLRGNAGGNFVAGLRFLSLFLCEPQTVGILQKPRFPESLSAELPNDLRDEEQLAVLDTHREVVLRTYASDPCFKGSVKVLVDGKSSSVAEMVAQALKEFRKAPLWGSPSRGQLLVGVWYPLEEAGPGVQISIPEAVYLSSQEHRIEGVGVQLDRVLYYNLPEMQAGIDSWVRRALD